MVHVSKYFFTLKTIRLISSRLFTDKAARDHYMKSVAHENPNIRVLNYAPGPLKTDMLETVRSQGHLAEFFKDGNILVPEQSAKKMIVLLERNVYENGIHMDYFELE